MAKQKKNPIDDIPPLFEMSRFQIGKMMVPRGAKVSQPNEKREIKGEGIG
jgi:hypothetical protein